LKVQVLLLPAGKDNQCFVLKIAVAKVDGTSTKQLLRLQLMLFGPAHKDRVIDNRWWCAVAKHL